MTTPARTLIDLAAIASENDQLATDIDDAVCRRLVPVDRVRRRAAAICGRGRSGSHRIRQALAGWQDIPGGRATPANRPEAALARWMRDAGFGGAGQHVVQVGGESYRLDWAWPAQRVALELDSYRWHGVPGRYRASLRRAARLRAAGWQIHGVTPEQVFERDAAVRIALERALLRGPVP